MTRSHSGSALLLGIGTILLSCCDAWTMPPRATALDHRRASMESSVQFRRSVSHVNMIGTGFSFEDGEQILVSVQKPFGIVLEQGNEEEDIDDARIVVTEVDPNGSAGKAGVREGDVLVAVQNASTVSADLGQVLDFIATKCPRVVNLRFERSS